MNYGLEFPGWASAGFGRDRPTEVRMLGWGYQKQVTAKVGSSLPVRCVASSANSAERRYSMLTSA